MTCYGRDIKRYGYDWHDLWLINTHNGIKGKVPKIEISKYPAIKNHLDQFKDKIWSRADQGDTPYNLRNCAYMDLFFQPKICWKAVGRRLAFALVEEGIYLTAPASFISGDSNNEILLAYLCSAVANYYINQYSDSTGAGDLMLNIQSLVKLPIPQQQSQKLIDAIKRENDDLIDQSIFEIYGFSKDEIDFICNYVS